MSNHHLAFVYLRPVLPPALLQSLNRVKGFNRLAFEAVHASNDQVTAVRINPLKESLIEEKSRLTVDSRQLTEQVLWCEHGFYLNERPLFTVDPLFHAGAYYVQDASSMFLWQAVKQLIPSVKNKKVLDLCAAPGGKSTLLASYFTGGLVVANEVIKSRAAVLTENIIKWGTGNVIVTNNDPAMFASLPNFFDVMVIDAPCSGSGLFRKDIDAISEWSEESVNLCSQRQQRIMADSFNALNEEGILIYSTCSYSEEEDEQIADWLVNNFPVTSCRLQINPDWNIVETESKQHKAFGYRFFPDKVKGEGFFMAAFRKNNSSSDKYITEQNIIPSSKQEINLLNNFYQLPENYFAFTHHQEIRIIKNDWLSDLKKLTKNLFIKKAGIGIGTIKGKDVIPSHELAISTMPLHQLPFIDVDKHTALEYLRKNDLSIQSKPGWNLVTYCELPLGWVKVLPNRINNYYPSEWRILKY